MKILTPAQRVLLEAAALPNGAMEPEQSGEWLSTMRQLEQPGLVRTRLRRKPRPTDRSDGMRAECNYFYRCDATPAGLEALREHTSLVIAAGTQFAQMDEASGDDMIERVDYGQEAEP